MLVDAGLRRGDRDQFDFCKLMLPDHAAGIATGRPRFGAEARRQRGQPHRQFFFVDDGFANQIGQRHFGGRDQPETIGQQPSIGIGEQFALDGPELIVLELRQLAGAVHHLVAHQQRRIDFGVAVLVGVQIEHELPDRTFQPRQAFLQHDKARAAQFGGGLEIHVAERAAEIVMRLGRKSVVADLAVDVALHVAVLVGTIRDFVERQVRNRGQFLREFVVGRLRRQLELRHGGLELGDLGHQRVGARVVLGLFGLADFL